jgi:diguanylate cyclase (GGDEF)-like protein
VLELSASLFDFLSERLRGAPTAALAVICLVQYVYHVCHARRSRREREVIRDELDVAMRELRQARRERSASRFEAQAMTEFVTRPDSVQALKGLARRYAAESRSARVLVALRRGGNWSLAAAYGFIGGEEWQISIDQSLERLLSKEPTVTLEGAQLRRNCLWLSLPAADRSCVSRLHLIQAPEDEGMAILLATSELAPQGLEPQQQINVSRRLLEAVASHLVKHSQLESSEVELEAADQMLALRSLLDGQFASPLEMIEEFIREAGVRCGAERVALAVAVANQSHTRILARSGVDLPGDIADVWLRNELTLARAAIERPEHAPGTPAELARLGVAPLLGAAVVVAVPGAAAPLGALVMTRRDCEPFTEFQRRLAQWVAERLADLLPRAGRQAAVERQARVDSLTGLLNRHSFEQHLAAEVASAGQAGAPLALVFLDLDRFKAVNDSFGHPAGDAVLRAAADLVADVKNGLRASDRVAGVRPVVARWGGEELALLLPRLGADAAVRIAETIRRKLSALEIDFDGKLLRVTTSAGVAVYPTQGQTPEALVAAADQALYCAKAQGRNRVVVAGRPASSESTSDPAGGSQPAMPVACETVPLPA